MVTANVNSLRPSDASWLGCRAGAEAHCKKKHRPARDNSDGRVALLEKEFDEVGADIIGIQESRVQGNFEYDGQIYHMISSGATEIGSHGVQIWLHRRLGASVVSTDAVSPRLLFAVVDLPPPIGRMILASAHAPQHGNELAVRTAFWELLRRKLAAHRRKHSKAAVCVCIDANGRVGQCEADSCYIGLRDATREDQNGEELHALLEAESLFACNTFFPSGPTWFHSSGRGSRIDYVLADADMFDKCTRTTTLDDVELAMSLKDDHVPLAAHFSATLDPQHSDVRRQPRRICRANTKDPEAVQYFKSILTPFRAPDDVQEHHAKLMRHIRRCALRAFGPEPARPKSFWMGHQTWALAKWRSPVRRLLGMFRKIEANVRLRMIFAAWRGNVRAVFSPGTTPCGRGIWAKLAALQSHGMLGKIRRCRAAAERTVTSLAWTVKALCKSDKLEALKEAQWMAADAQLRGDFAKASKILKSIACTPFRRSKAVRRADGGMASSTAEREAAWTTHLAKVFNGVVTSSADEMASARREDAATPSSFYISQAQVESALGHVNGAKALGPDMIDGSTLHAGGSELAQIAHELISKVVDRLELPVAWKGGRAVDLYKGKGDHADPDCSRVLLIQDHIGKAFVGLIKDPLIEPFEADNPGAQFGGIADGATDVPTHIVASFISSANLRCRCWVVIFLDLEKAFDKVAREILMPPPAYHRGSLADHLMQCGMSDAAATWAADFVDNHGCVLEQWGVEHTVQLLVSELHSGAWMRYGDSSDVVVSRTGGRQGCKLGGLVFGGVYNQALKRLRRRVVDGGQHTRVECDPTRAFWSAEAPTPTHGADLVDVTFVDDEALMVESDSPTALLNDVNDVLEAVTDVFANFGLILNWRKGKSEAMMRLFGRGSGDVLESLRRPSGELAFPLPERCGDQHLLIVPSYKHLGTRLTTDLCFRQDAKTKSRAGMAAHVMLAGKVLRSDVYPVAMKVQAVTSFVLSRCLFNAHLWDPNHHVIRSANAPYARALRTIAGEWWSGDEKPCLSDVAIRRQLGAPSIDSLLLQARLKYVGRLCRVRHLAIWALLQARHKGKAISWVNQCKADLQLAFQLSPVAQSLLPDPSLGLAHEHAWLQFITTDETAWQRVIRECEFTESINDKNRDAPARQPGCASFQCGDCALLFPTQKALDQHRRIRHGAVAQIQWKVGDTAVCLKCGTDFRQRFRLVAHRSQTRAKRRICADWYRTNVPDLHDDVVCPLREADLRAQREARSGGHTHAIACRRAVGPGGKASGRVTH